MAWRRREAIEPLRPHRLVLKFRLQIKGEIENKGKKGLDTGTYYYYYYKEGKHEGRPKRMREMRGDMGESN